MLSAHFILRIFAAGSMVLGAGMASSQEYPNKLIHLVAGAPGGGGDFVGRIVVQGLTTRLGWQMIVDNRGAGLASAEVVVKAPPDGYTLTIQGSSLWITPLLRKAPYDAVRDFSPISLLVREVLVAAVHPSVPVKSVKELIALAKARPGELNYAITTIGGAPHLAGELFKSMTGVNIVFIPYKGLAPALTAVSSGEVQLAFIDGRVLMPHMKSGKVKGLAVTSATTSALVPGMPTVAASGLPGYELIGMTITLAPAKTPGAIINRLNQEIVRVLNLPDVEEKFINAGVEVVGSSPEQLAATMTADIAKMTKLIKDAGIKVD